MNVAPKEHPPVSERVNPLSRSLLVVVAVAAVLCGGVIASKAVETAKPDVSKAQSTNAVPAAVQSTNATPTKAESKKHKILKFLFDGVPDEGVTNKVTKTGPRRDSTRKRPSVLSAFRFSQNTTSNFVFHPPFEKQECGQCHGGSALNPVLKMPQLELCMQCHKKNFAMPVAVKHKPVEMGQCTKCHDPHRSPNKKLLLRTGNALCLKCHEQIGQEPVKHAALEMNGCLECHLPHGGPNKFLTKFAGKELCYKCHDDFAKTAKFVHAPVESGDCTVCHNPHSTQNEKLLKHKGGDTCYQCHDDFQSQLQVAKSVHAPIQNGECMMCHTPHASNERFMLAKPGSTICMDCHEQKDMAALAGHAGSEGKSCVECHNPHFSEQKHLLKPVSKALTALPKSQ